MHRLAEKRGTSRAAGVARSLLMVFTRETYLSRGILRFGRIERSSEEVVMPLEWFSEGDG
jgi:hypothetical protein